MKLFSFINRGRIVLSNKKRNLRKYSVVFFKAFSKIKKIFDGPVIRESKKKINFLGFIVHNSSQLQYLLYFSCVVEGFFFVLFQR